MSDNNFKLANRIEVRSKYSNIDALYGPYESVEAAYEAIPESRRAIGLTVGIIENGSIIEYWWKSGISNEDLKTKIEEYKLEINNVTYTTDPINNTITFNIEVSGKGFGVETSIYLGSNKITSVATLLNLTQSITIKAPENPGNYNYTISAIDSILNNGTQLNKEVIWKEIDIKINSSSPIYTYTVKSLLNLQNSNFSFLIYKIDSVNISRVSIIYGNNLKVLFDGQDYHDTYNVNISSLDGLESGDLILIKIEGSMSEAFIKNVVLLTSPGIFSSCEGLAPSQAYNNLSFSATFKFESENIANYQVVIKDNDEDIIYNSSLLSYTNNTITLVLSDSTLSDTKRFSQHNLYVYIGNSESANYIFDTITLVYVSNTEKLENLTDAIFSNKLDFNLSLDQELTVQSFILDLVCYIPYYTRTDNTEEEEEDSSILFLFGGITINKDFILFRNIIYPTPILLNISLGFMCNVKSSYQNKEYYYDALFIDGVLCFKTPNSTSPQYKINSKSKFKDKVSNKIRLYYSTENPILQSPDGFVLELNFKSRNPGQETSNLPTFNITPINNIKTKADLTAEQIEQIVNNKITIDGTEYDIIDTIDYRTGEFGNLGDSKYELDILLYDFCDKPAYNLSRTGLSVDEIISKLSKLVKKDPSKIPDNYTTLTRLIVKSKKLLQKYIAVPCEWNYGNERGYLLAFTQGTSTLEYALPNFTFKFYVDKTFTSKQTVSLIPKIDRNLTNILTYSNEVNNNTLYYSENELVAKADYMESSHLNNTPTAMFYNALTTLSDGYSITDSNTTIQILKNPVLNKLNAIEGIPIVLIINGINYGSFMLNIGKTGNSIGFGNNGISLEGTNNDNNEGLSSRFEFHDKDVKAKNYFDNIENVDDITEVNSDFISFLQEGLEYRYSGANADDIGDDLEEYKRILKMWSWVYSHESYSKSEFEQVFNFDFAALYYIQMMNFGQTDNLGKNCMFDQFEENGLWYVRPYDMDSQAGLDNNGFDRLSPVIEIAQLFVLDEGTKDIELISYLGDDSSTRFPYSSKTSNLWIRFYNNLKSEILIFYKYLRNLGYSAEAVISLCEKEVINKLGINLYNKDFQNKYLSNENVSPYELFAYGNRWFRFKDWIQKRFDFCDTYFGYNEYSAGTSGTTRLFKIKYSLPQYTIYSYNDATGGANKVSNWGIETNLNFLSITKLTLWFSPKYIIDDDNIFLTGFTNMSPRVKLNNLINYSGTWNNLCNVVDLSENTYLLLMTINNIGTSGDGHIPNSVQNLTINNSSLIPRLENFSNLTKITFTGCEGNIYLGNCENLTEISINSCKSLNLTLVNCGNENLYTNLKISNSTFNLIIINGSFIKCLNLQGLRLNLSFVGEQTNIKVVNLYLTTLLNSTSELNISTLNAETLILNQLTGLSDIKVITNIAKSFKFLGLYQSNIILFGNIDNVFDGSYIENLSDVKDLNNVVTVKGVRMIETINDTVITNLINGTYSSSIEFRLYSCSKILEVINLNLKGSASLTRLFQNCNSLRKIRESEIQSSAQYMFSGCWQLNELPVKNNKSTITIIGTEANYMFNECHSLSYNYIKQVLENNITSKYWNENEQKYQEEQISGITPITACKITNYNNFLYVKTYSSDTTIDLNDYAFGTDMDYCFSVHKYSTQNDVYRNLTQNVVITFSGKLPKSLVSAYSTFASIDNHKYIIDDDAIQDCKLLLNLDFCFAYNKPWDNTYFKVPKFPNNTMTLGRTCMESNINITNFIDSTDNKVYLPSNITLCYTMFYRATLSERTEVSQIFSKCINLTNVTNCFRLCLNYTCTSPLNFSNNTKFVNIAGIFAEAENNNIIQFGFTNKWYSQMYDNSSDNLYVIGNFRYNDSNLNLYRVGPYYNSKINIEGSINIDDEIHPIQGLLNGANINNELNGLILNIKCSDCRSICKDFKSSSNTKLEISLQNIQYANNAFNGTELLYDINSPIMIPNTLVNGQYMFANTKISRLPENLNLCQNLNDISYMFLNCIDLEDEFDMNDPFLPISVKNIDYLFDGCNKLYGGIPSKFIQTLTITDTETGEEVIQKNNINKLECTFAKTRILSLSPSEESRNNSLGLLNISELFPNVNNVTGLFYACGKVNNGNLTQQIDPLCFSKCKYCDDLFNSAYVKLPNGFVFAIAESLRYAFATGADEDRNITNVSFLLKPDITGLFSRGSATSSVKNSEVENNKNTLLELKNQTNIFKGMLFGYNDISDDISKSEYLYHGDPPRRIITYRGY